MKTNAFTPEALAIRSLRVKALLDEVPKTEIAKKVGVGRNAIAENLKSDDMSLGRFLKIAKAIDADPEQIIRESIEEYEKSATEESPNSNAALD